jgi:hypothetical protein
MDFSTTLGLFVWFVRWLFKRGFPALEDLDIPPTNPRVSRHRKAALCFFMCFAGLFLCGSLIRVFANAEIGDAVGWTGLGCFVVSAVCLLWSASINGQRPVSDSAESVMCDKCARPAEIHMETHCKTGETTWHHWCVHHGAQKLQLGADWKSQVQASLREG